MADLDAIIKPGVSAIVLKVLNEAGAKSLGKCIQIKNFQGNRFTKLVISFVIVFVHEYKREQN